MAFRKAVKKHVKLRLAIYSISGGGKTFSSLRLATGLAQHVNGGQVPAAGEPGGIAVIDTENGDSELYANRFEFMVNILVDKTIAGYMAAFVEAAALRPSVLIIDGGSHAWRELLEQVDRDKTGRNGRENSFNAWANATPLQKEFIDAIKSFDGHLIMTMRADTLWAVRQNSEGKNVPEKIGLKPEQGKGIEFEFSMLMSLDEDNHAHIEKDRTSRYQGARIPLITEDFGKELGAWLDDGVLPASPGQLAEIRRHCKDQGIGGKRFAELFGATPSTHDEAAGVLDKLRAMDPTIADAAALKAKADALSTSLDDDKGDDDDAEDAADADTDDADDADDGGADDSADDGVMGTTETLLAVKRDVDAVKTAEALAKTIAKHADAIAALPMSARVVANGYLNARLADITDEPVGDAAAKAVEDMAKIAGGH